MERGTDAGGAAEVADWQPPGEDLPKTRRDRGADMPLETQPRPSLKESGELVPKSLVGGLQQRVEELKRAWGGRH
ncbi:MAG: hypothetical protein SGJ16_08930 [Nitrospirota bacterium]|nr:hypothetical protein [Nitrospirota bacterium]